MWADMQIWLNVINVILFQRKCFIDKFLWSMEAQNTNINEIGNVICVLNDV